MDYVLKRILPSGIDAALQKADKYRELNQPAEAESICRDVLAVDPDHQLARRVLGLAITDQFVPSSGPRFAEAEEVFAGLRDPYERTFYTGIALERRAKAQLAAGVPLYAARPLFQQALTPYAEAEALPPPGHDAPILRRNSCVRSLQAVPGLGTAYHDVMVDAETDFVPVRR